MKRSLASNQWHEFRLKAAVQDFCEESGPSAILVLVNETAWATCPPPPPLPQLGPSPFPLLEGTGEPTTLPWWNDRDPERHSVPSTRSLETSQLRFPSCRCRSRFLNQLVNQQARQRSWLVPGINRPLKWSLTSLHAFPTLLLTPETLHPAARTGLTLFLNQDVLIKKKNQTNQRKLYYQTIALTAKSLLFYSFTTTTVCFWLKYYSQWVFRKYKIIQNLFRLTTFHICFKISNRHPT